MSATFSGNHGFWRQGTLGGTLEPSNSSPVRRTKIREAKKVGGQEQDGGSRSVRFCLVPLSMRRHASQVPSSGENAEVLTRVITGCLHENSVESGNLVDVIRNHNPNQEVAVLFDLG